jgi:hypothetical protein
LRSEMRPTWRWSRMKAPTSAQRSSRSFIPDVTEATSRPMPRRSCTDG